MPRRRILVIYGGLCPIFDVMSSDLPVFLHVGCGRKRKDRTPFANQSWKELRLDIDLSVEPDFVGSMTDMSSVQDESMDAIFSSHNIEHLYPHEVPLALNEFRRVLKSDGFLLLTCPDLQSVCSLVADDKLTDAAYISGAGPITPHDILYGHSDSMRQGNLYMAHRCGFTQKVMAATLQKNGFSAGIKVRSQNFDLWAVAVFAGAEDRLNSLIATYLDIL